MSQHSQLLMAQNKTLQQELDSFVETDDVVKRNLDRKDKVWQIRQQVDQAIQKSKAKSPAKYDTNEKKQYLDVLNQSRQSFNMRESMMKSSPLRRS